MNASYIAIEGNIGAGKTSLVTLLGQKFKSETLFETFENNPFLPEFYKDTQKNAFPLEMFFLAERYKQLTAIDAGQHKLFGNGLISDYYISKSLIFAGFTLQPGELDLFKRFYEVIEKQVALPELLIYIHREVPFLLKQIAKRGRGYESDITAQYLENVNNGYYGWFKQETRMPVIIINSGNIDFYEEGALEALIDKVFTRKWAKGLQILDL
ncbi:MAG TPA: deoxynucleoside kinase [Flavobacteriales bacterium]|nr:deoxynucleoside kinase [Flavobacteriales bacterium]